jgi:hypothetical protein
MIQVIFNMGVCLAIVVAIVAGLAIGYFYLKALWQARPPKSEGFHAQVRQAIAESGLAKTQQAWISEMFLPRMAEYRRLSRSANRQFNWLSKSSVVSPYVAAGVGMATMTVMQSYWLWGAFIGSILGGIGLLAKAFNAIDTNALRWVDYDELANLMEESLTQLLTDDASESIAVRWKQFRQEYEVIGRRAQELLTARNQAAQLAANVEASAAQVQLRDLKQARREPQASRLPQVAEVVENTQVRSVDGDHFQGFSDRLKSAPVPKTYPSQIPFPDEDDDLMPSEALTEWRR